MSLDHWFLLLNLRCSDGDANHSLSFFCGYIPAEKHSFPRTITSLFFWKNTSSSSSFTCGESFCRTSTYNIHLSPKGSKLGPCLISSVHWTSIKAKSLPFQRIKRKRHGCLGRWSPGLVSLFKIPNLQAWNIFVFRAWFGNPNCQWWKRITVGALSNKHAIFIPLWI